MPARGRVKRVYPRTSPRVRRTRNMPALKERNRTRWAFVPPLRATPESSRQSKGSSQNPVARCRRMNQKKQPHYPRSGKRNVPKQRPTRPSSGASVRPTARADNVTPRIEPLFLANFLNSPLLTAKICLLQISSKRSSRLRRHPRRTAAPSPVATKATDGDLADCVLSPARKRAASQHVPLVKNNDPAADIRIITH
jgi:hypothetical protein